MFFLIANFYLVMLYKTFAYKDFEMEMPQKIMHLLTVFV